jgi:type I pantothenate kinase
MFDRAEWAALRANTPMSLTDPELAMLRGLNEPVSITDVAEIFLPLSRLLNLHVLAARSLKNVVEGAFLGHPSAPPPCVIGIAGSVAVGKSTFARVLQVLACACTLAYRKPSTTEVAFVYRLPTIGFP